MAERRRGRKTSLARVYAAAIFRGEPRQIEDFGFRAGIGRNDCGGDLDQAPAFRHFSRAGMLAARRAVDEKNASRPARVFVLRLRGENGAARVEPIDGQIVIGVGESRTRLEGVRTFPALLVRAPGRVGDAVQIASQAVESRIDELRSKARLEFAFAYSGARHSFSRFGRCFLVDPGGHLNCAPSPFLKSKRGDLVLAGPL